MSGAETPTGLRAWLDTDTPQSRLQARSISAWNAWRTLSSNALAMVGLAIIVVLVLMAIFAPLIATHAPNAQDLAGRLRPPGWQGHILGTDELGRDIFSRIVYGARVTLYIVALVAVTAPVFGLIVGTVAGTLGGWTDRILMRITDIFLAFPRLILALAFVAALGPGIVNAVLAIALTAWPAYARVARAETLTVRRSDYIAAARLQGASTLRIITGHIMPMCLSSVVVRVTLDSPDGSFPWKMAWGDAVILDPASAAQAATAPVGTGPFRLVSREPDRRTVLERQAAGATAAAATPTAASRRCC